MIAVFVETADGMPERPDHRLAHLETCPECARRYEAIMQSLVDLREEARAEADEVFSSERLEGQRTQILDRLAHAFNPARVLPFPSRTTSYFTRATTSQVHRWVAVAAAAGLLVGVGLGRMSGVVTSRPVETRLTRPAVTAPRQPLPGPLVQTAQQRLNDEDLLSQADRPPRLGQDYETLDALTPHVMTTVALSVR
jgi:hypothetical protein